MFNLPGRQRPEVPTCVQQLTSPGMFKPVCRTNTVGQLVRLSLSRLQVAHWLLELDLGVGDDLRSLWGHVPGTSIGFPGRGQSDWVCRDSRPTSWAGSRGPRGGRSPRFSRSCCGPAGHEMSAGHVVATSPHADRST